MLIGEIPRDRSRNSEDRNEGAEFIEQRNAGAEDADGAVDQRRREPDPDEQRGAGPSASPKKSGAEVEHRERDETKHHNHEHVHLIPSRPRAILLGLLYM